MRVLMHDLCPSSFNNARDNFMVSVFRLLSHRPKIACCLIVIARSLNLARSAATKQQPRDASAGHGRGCGGGGGDILRPSFL